MKKVIITFLILLISFTAFAQQNTMVRINGGTFTMGSPANEPGRGSDEIQRQVTISSFQMSRYPITQREYQEIMGTNPSRFRRDNHPVEMVTWFDAIEYCIRRSQREGLTPAYTMTNRVPASGYPITNATVTINWNANGYRLPTEAEWEYACRAGTTTRYWSGNDETSLLGKANVGDLTLKDFLVNAGQDVSSMVFVNIHDGHISTSPVGSFTANAWGLHDMHGNVFEWCWDWYGPYATATGTQNNPTGAVSGEFRVLRGGSWGSSGQYLRSAFRNSYNPDYRLNARGFRVVRP